MARIRSIKPEFWTSEQVVSMNPISRLLFIGLWTHCDDRGVHPASPITLKMRVFPGDAFTIPEISGMVNQMIDAGLIIQFESDGQSYWYVTGWDLHQKVDKPSNKYPAPPKITNNSTSIRRAFDEHSGTELLVGNGIGNGIGKEVLVVNAPENFLNENNHPTPPSETTEFEKVKTVLNEYLRPDDWGRLRKHCDDAKYDPQVFGPASDEVRGFISYNLACSAKRKFLENPVDFFEVNFPRWLKNAKQFNRRQKEGKGKPPPYKIAPEAVRSAAARIFGELSRELSDDDVEGVAKAKSEAEMHEWLNSAMKRAQRRAEFHGRTGPTTMTTITPSAVAS